MVDTVTSQILDSGPRNLIVKFTNESDGTGEVLVKKVDVTTFTPSPSIHLKVRRIIYAISGMTVRLYWDATPPVDMAPLAGFGNLDYSSFGGLTVPVIAGATGSILLSTNGAEPGSFYDLTLEISKNVAL